ncbi:hypothetical protein PG987_003552 [Apiospora arundinis]
MTGRRVGLSKKESVKHLLSAHKAASTPKMEDVDVNAPPQASDSEPEAPPKAEYHDSDSEEGWQTQKDIEPTDFSGGKRSRSLDAVRKEGCGLRSIQLRTARMEEGRSKSRAPGRSKMPPGRTGANHHVDDHGFSKSIKSSKKKYGGNSQRSSQNSAPRSSAPQESSTKAQFKRHNVSSSPSGTPEAASSKAKLIEHSPIKFPSKTPAKQKLRSPNLDLGGSPKTSKSKGPLDSSKRPGANGKQRAAFKAPTLDDLDLGSDDERFLRNRNKGNTPEAQTEKLPKRPTIKLPDLEGLGSFADNMAGVEVLSTQRLGFMKDESSNEDLVSELSSDEDSPGDTNWQETSVVAHCPMCGQPVDSELLKKHTTRGRMTIRQQTTFCLSHKRKEAEEIRKDNSYPEVDWDELEARFTAHKDLINDILMGDRASHFASLLSNKVEAGKDRTLLKTDESLTPGYYGPRGLRVMTELIMHSFSDTVRKRAIEDHLVSARTYTGYVQSVLVPELAVRLIMEDMDVDEESARQIMDESRGLGDVLHEETRDVVVRESDDED